MLQAESNVPNSVEKSEHYQKKTNYASFTERGLHTGEPAARRAENQLFVHPDTEIYLLDVLPHQKHRKMLKIFEVLNFHFGFVRGLFHNHLSPGEEGFVLQVPEV